MVKFLTILVAILITILPSACTFSEANSPPIDRPTLPLPPTNPVVTPITPPPIPSPTPILEITFAVLGDYGIGNQKEGDVANLVKSWEPDLILTTGDNNYPDGTANTIDKNIGQFFHDYIFPYRGNFGYGSTHNKFFPSLGNHDWITKQAQPYLEYFSLPGNERYYKFTTGPVEFFALDSDSREPDGVGVSSIQAEWLKRELVASTASWQVVFFHHAPYSSALHGSTDWMQWPFKEWGVDLVFSGHDHTYEHLLIDGLDYVVIGLGGASIYDFFIPIPGSILRYNQDYGAVKVYATPDSIHVQLITVASQVVDDFYIEFSH